MVKAIHRHHGPVVGYKFAVGVEDFHEPSGYEMRAVAICGRPVARRLDDGRTLEVLRLATPWQFRNACSALYGASARVAKEMGYLDIISYILEAEPGTSLRASGWHFCKEVDGGSWDVPSRRRTDKHPIGRKARWHRQLGWRIPSWCGLKKPAAKGE